MVRPTRVLAVVTLIALTVNFSGFAFGAAAGKGGANKRGGKANEQMSTKGSSNTNAQWSADPDRGWVRAEERHKMHDKTSTSNVAKQTGGKQKAKGKGKKS